MDGGVIDQFVAAQAPPEVIEAARKRAKPSQEAYELWEENQPAFNLFYSIRTQWRAAPMGGVIGLDYGVLHRELDDLGLSGEDRQRMKDDIRAMEQAALKVLNKQGT